MPGTPRILPRIGTWIAIPTFIRTWEITAMMKQPAENPNATLAEAEAASARTRQISTDSSEIHEEVANLAYQLWQERQGQGGSAEEDWFRAETIVKNRLKARSTAY
jgi:hypothetical protein